MVELKPWGELFAHKIEEAHICVMGVPFDGAVSCGKGAALAPEVMRSLSRYLPPYTEGGDLIEHKIYDAGDVPIVLDWETYYGNVEAEAFKLLGTGKFCLFLGGDHSVSIPLHKAFFRACANQKTGVIHFDSHADLCDAYDGHKWSHACTARRASEQMAAPGDIAFVGLRSWEQEEVEYLKEHPEIIVKRAKDVAREGYQAVTEQLIAKFKAYDALYLTVDIDVLDPAFAPGTGTPEAGGLSSRELMEMVAALVKALPITAMDIVEVSPSLDTRNNITSWAALKLLYEAIYCVKK